MNLSVRVSRCCTFTGNIVAIAGRKNIEKKNAAITPIAAILPKSLNGGESLVLSDKNPIAVVTEVRKIGMKLTRRLSFIASFFSFPLRISLNQVDNRWTQSATANVIIMTGADMTGVDNSNPIHPAKPKAVPIDIKITNMVAMVPLMLLKSRKTVIKISSNASGSKFFISKNAASLNALFNITIPDRYTVKSG